ncbi:MAG: hypothetical protein NVS4B11_27080 [Ktedonobacteraceae bacterium]
MKHQFVHIGSSQRGDAAQFLPINTPKDVTKEEAVVLPRDRHNAAVFKRLYPQEVSPSPDSQAKKGLLTKWADNATSILEHVAHPVQPQSTKRVFRPAPFTTQASYSSVPQQQSFVAQPFSAFTTPSIGQATTLNREPNTPPLGLPLLAETARFSVPGEQTWRQQQQQQHLSAKAHTQQGNLGKPNTMPHVPQVQPVLPVSAPAVSQKPAPILCKKRRFPLWAHVLVASSLILLVLVGSGMVYYYATFDHTLKNTVGQVVTRPSGDNEPSGATGNNSDILSGRRINILLLGSDTDVKFMDASGHSVYLAQTDIVVTVDPQTQSVGMLSIPRDTWLNAPGYGMMKLDEVYKTGGVALSRYTIHQDFGIYIDYYAWVGLDGFIKVINTVGGVDIDVLHPITDDNYPDDIGNHGNDIYALKRLYLAPGPQHLAGPEALEYVRSRHADLVGDFGRSIRQQQVLTQLKTKLNNPSIIGKLPELANDLNGFVKTDMQLPDVFRLMNFARSLDQSKINRVTLGPPYSQSAQVKATDGSMKDIVELNCGQVEPVIATMFQLGDTAKCDIQGSTSGQQGTQTARALQSVPTFLASSSILQTTRISQSENGTNLFGIHDLLDLMFFVVFESPDATNV